MSLGSQVKKYRTAAGCTYADIEAMSEVSTGNINALEKRSSLRSEHTQALARAFGLTIDQLLDEKTDYSEHVRRHVAQWRTTKTMPQSTPGTREPTPISYTWPFALSPERLLSALSRDDIQRIDAYILGIVEAREAEQGKQTPLASNGRP